MSNTQLWIEGSGFDCAQLQRDLSECVATLATQGAMPPNECERVAAIKIGIADGAFVASPKRLELLRGLCQIYSAGIRSEKITSHRPVVGPLIVFVKRALFPVVSTLLGPSFRFQREFNAGVIRLLGDLCNEAGDKEDTLARN
jgi:hypothetical protein